MTNIDNPVFHVFNAQELTLKIFSYLGDFRELCRVARVCKIWKAIAADNALWEPLFISTFLKGYEETHENTESFKQRFINCYCEKKWTGALEYCFVRALWDDEKKYVVRAFKDYIVLQKFTHDADSSLIFDKNGKRATFTTLPDDISEFIDAFNQEKKLLQQEIKKSGYTFSFKGKILTVTRENASKLELDHADKQFANENVIVETCISLIPNSSLLVTAAKYTNKSGYIFFVWDLSSGKCINRTDPLECCVKGPSFFCARDNCIFIASLHGLRIMNLEGKTLSFMDVDPLGDRGYMNETQIHSVTATKKGIYALDDFGSLHIWKQKKGEKKPLENLTEFDRALFRNFYAYS